MKNHLSCLFLSTGKLLFYLFFPLLFGCKKKNCRASLAVSGRATGLARPSKKEIEEMKTELSSLSLFLFFSFPLPPRSLELKI
jgi:hypothetical protein